MQVFCVILVLALTQLFDVWQTEMLTVLIVVLVTVTEIIDSVEVILAYK